MSSKSTTKDPGVEFRWFTMGLVLLLITLKLTGHITWSWWWVLSPLWGPSVIVLGVLALMLMAWCLYLGAAALLDYRDDKRKRRKRKMEF